jgi:hypothetical protein
MDMIEMVCIEEREALAKALIAASEAFNKMVDEYELEGAYYYFNFEGGILDCEFKTVLYTNTINNLERNVNE